MNPGMVYLVVDKWGKVWFGQFTGEHCGAVFIGGLFNSFVTGIYLKEGSRILGSWRAPMPNETESMWRGSVNLL